MEIRGGTARGGGGTDISPKSLKLLTGGQSHNSPDHNMYEGKSLNNRNFILKCMEKYAQ